MFIVDKISKQTKVFYPKTAEELSRKGGIETGSMEQNISVQ